MNLKKYLPVESFTLKTALSAEDVRKRIAKNIAPQKGLKLRLAVEPRGLFFPESVDDFTASYRGHVTDKSFRLIKIAPARTFLPVITGSFENYPDQTIVSIKMRLLTPVLIFICFWTGATLFAGIGMTLAALFDTGGPSLVVALVPFAMFLFVWAMMLFSFRTESSNSRQFLLSALEAEEMQDYNFK